MPICSLLFACLRTPLNFAWFRFECYLSSRLFPFSASDLSYFYLHIVPLKLTIARDVKTTNATPANVFVHGSKWPLTLFARGFTLI